uniref:Uncharacterized protein n=1 Tax=Heterorhabditis bacteriophora TaxID=37862 RepID=A0A1I7X552_HETBA
MVVIGMEMNLYQFVIMIPYLELISCTHVSYIFGLLNRTVAGRKQ